jgi:hypothetical protein
MFKSFALVVGAVTRFSACSVFQYAALPAVIDASPGYYFTETAKAPQTDIVFVQTAVTDAW